MFCYGHDVSAPRTARARVRAQLTEEILRAAQEELVEHGAAGLSLRAVARRLEMVPSAVYRYFPNRDALFTALIVDAYLARADAAENVTRGPPPAAGALAGGHRRRAPLGSRAPARVGAAVRVAGSWLPGLPRDHDRIAASHPCPVPDLRGRRAAARPSAARRSGAAGRGRPDRTGPPAGIRARGCGGRPHGLDAAVRHGHPGAVRALRRHHHGLRRGVRLTACGVAAGLVGGLAPRYRGLHGLSRHPAAPAASAPRARGTGRRDRVDARPTSSPRCSCGRGSTSPSPSRRCPAWCSTPPRRSSRRPTGWRRSACRPWCSSACRRARTPSVAGPRTPTGSCRSRCGASPTSWAIGMVLIADLCLDEYTDHGHCGILDARGEVDNDLTLERYAGSPSPRPRPAPTWWPRRG